MTQNEQGQDVDTRLRQAVRQLADVVKVPGAWGEVSAIDLVVPTYEAIHALQQRLTEAEGLAELGRAWLDWQRAEAEWMTLKMDSPRDQVSAVRTRIRETSARFGSLGDALLTLPEVS